MGNGQNERIEFTRGDAERLTRIDTNMSTLIDFMTLHIARHESLEERVRRNTMFRSVLLKALLFIFPSGAAVLAALQLLGLVHIVG